jgi:hypothetical protein
MKKAMGIVTGAAFIAALGIVGAVERGADVRLMWWTLPLIVVMGIAAFIADAEQSKKYFCEVVLKMKK